MQNQDSESLQTQNIGETEVPDAQDTSDTPIKDDGTDSQLNPSFTSSSCTTKVTQNIIHRYM